MNYILILLITISFAFGQYEEDDWSTLMADWNDVWKPQEETFEAPDIFYPQFQTHWLDEPITPRMLFDYAEECYNDSIIEIYKLSHYEWREIINIMAKDGYYFEYKDSTGTAYFKKQPTFPGFIEWYMERIELLQ